jgi:lysophospholipase L1-like esterase
LNDLVLDSTSLASPRIHQFRIDNPNRLLYNLPHDGQSSKSNGRLNRFFFAILILEIAFSVAHSLRQAARKQSSTEKKFDSDGNTIIRFSIIGESTTEPVYDQQLGDISWPAQLETKLNAYLEEKKIPYRASIRNLAQAATSSPFQFIKLKEDAGTHPPDVLLSMIGFNDTNRLWETQRSFLYRNSYLYRWIYWLQTAWFCKNCSSSDLSTPTPYLEAEPLPERTKSLMERARMVTAMFKDKIEAETTGAARKLVFINFRTRFEILLNNSSDTETPWISAAIADGLFHIFQQTIYENTDFQKEGYLYALNLLESHKDVVALNHGRTLEILCHLKSFLTQSCLDDLRTAFQNGLPLSSPLLAIATAQDDVDNDAFFRQLFSRLGYDLEFKTESIARLYYKRFADFANENDVLWFAIQYPTGAKDALKLFFLEESDFKGAAILDSFYSPPPNIVVPERFKNVVLVGNENFNDLVNESNTAEYFTDLYASRIGHRYGHTTAKGHAVIADNVLQALIDNWDKVESTVKRRRAANH